MGTRDFEKLLTDLKNLPKQNAPEDFEEKLFRRINDYEMSRASGEKSIRKFFVPFLNPIYAPAFVLIIVGILIAYTVNQNNPEVQTQNTTVEKATPVIQEQITQITEPQKISVPKKKEFVVKRDRAKLNLGPGINLDEETFSFNPNQTKQTSFIEFPYPNEPITIRIPPPEVLFKNELEKMDIPFGNKDSIRLTNSRRR
ncbi:MAG: hypothetical protein N2043_12480 [Ignavibacterium sp.]|nr:hypothetical protein [Ignavibacterium sp.]